MPRAKARDLVARALERPSRLAGRRASEAQEGHGARAEDGGPPLGTDDQGGPLVDPHPQGSLAPVLGEADVPSRAPPPSFWLALVAVLAFASWCVFLMLAVRGERAQVESRVIWMVEAQSLRRELQRDASERAPDEPALRITLIRGLAGLESQLSSHDPPAAPLLEIVHAAEELLARSTAPTLTPEERAELLASFDRFVGAARADTRNYSQKLGERWNSLYVVTLAAVLFAFVALALFLLADRRRRRAEHWHRAALETLAQAERARASEAQANAAKTKFLSSMSHELRTPLNGVLGSAELLLTGELDEEQHAHARTIQECGELLLSLIQTILEFSELSREGVTITRRDFELEEVVREASRLHFDVASRKGLQTTLSLAPELPARVHGDPGRVGQLLSSLLDNAVKFTRAGAVELSVRPAGADHVRFEVRDTGIGLNTATLTELLEPFSREDASNTGVYSGAGLGLAICHRIVNALEGRLDAESQVGRGSTFWFTIPLPADRPPRPARAD